MTEMENQSSSTAKVMKKLKVDSFMITGPKDDPKKETKIIALCIVGENLSLAASYEERIIDVPEFEAFLRRGKYTTAYAPSTMRSLMCDDLARYLNEKEGRTEEMEEPKFEEPKYKHPVNQIFGHINDAIANYNHFSL